MRCSHTLATARDVALPRRASGKCKCRNRGGNLYNSQFAGAAFPLDAFVRFRKGKDATTMLPESNSVIVVIGLGHVGLPLAVEFGIKFFTVGLEVSKAQEEVCVPVLEPLSAMQEIAAVGLKIEEAARRQRVPVRLVADTSAIQCVLGWAPRFDDLRAISETAYRWERNRQQRGLGPRKRFGAA